MNEDVYRQNFDALKSEYETTYNQLSEEYKSEVAKVNARLSSRLKNVNREVETYTKSLQEKDALSMLPEATRKKVETAMQKAAQRLEAKKVGDLRMQDNALFEMFGMTGGMGAFATKNFLSGINKALADIGEYAASQGLSSQLIDWARNKASVAEGLQTGLVIVTGKHFKIGRAHV